MNNEQYKGGETMFFQMITAASMLSDQYVKTHIDEWLGSHNQKPIYNGNVILRKYHNEGMALQSLSRYPWTVRLLNGAAVLMTGAFLRHLRRKKGFIGLKLGFSLILGGGLSNLFDRFTKGYVVDYFSIKFPNKDLEKLVFNLADMFVFLGGIIVLASKKVGKRD